MLKWVTKFTLADVYIHGRVPKGLPCASKRCYCVIAVTVIVMTDRHKQLKIGHNF